MGRAGAVALAVCKQVAKTDRGVALAALVRNQCDRAIGYHFGATSESALNGEDRFVRTLSPGITRFIDIGANVGSWSNHVVSLNPGTEGVALEPGRVAFGRLVEGLPPGVQAVQAAAGARPGSLRLFEAAGGGEHSSLVSSEWAGGATGQLVDVTTIDTLISERGWDSVDFLKVDTEGFDGQVLEGGVASLGRAAIGVVQFEYNRPWRQAGRTLGGALGLLREHGYDVGVLTTDGPRHYDDGLFGDFFEYANFVAFRPGHPRADLVQAVRAPRG